MKNLLSIAVAVSLLTLAGCSKGEDKEDNKQEGVKTEAPSSVSAATKGKYQIKSGALELKVENNMIKTASTQKLYFDDYGKKERTETITEFEMMGQNIRSVGVVMNDGKFVYSFDPEKKTGTKSKFFGSNSGAQYDFESFSEEMKKDWKLKKEGTVDILGKTCDKYSIDNEKSKMKGTVCLWKGLALATDLDMGGIKMKMTAVKFDEGASVPAEMFEVPQDVKFEEF